MFNESIVRIKYARSTIGYSEDGTYLPIPRHLIVKPFQLIPDHT